jgi:hypothetical protein
MREYPESDLFNFRKGMRVRMAISFRCAAQETTDEAEFSEPKL